MKQAEAVPVHKNHSGSKTGLVLAVVSLVLSAIGSAFVRAKYKPTGPTSGSVNNEVGNAVASGTTKVLGAIFGVPLLVGGIALAILAIVLILIRLRNVRSGGLLFSVLAGVIAVWSFTIATHAFSTIKAKSVEPPKSINKPVLDQ